MVAREPGAVGAAQQDFDVSYVAGIGALAGGQFQLVVDGRPATLHFTAGRLRQEPGAAPGAELIVRTSSAFLDRWAAGSPSSGTASSLRPERPHPGRKRNRPPDERSASRRAGIACVPGPRVALYRSASPELAAIRGYLTQERPNLGWLARDTAGLLGPRHFVAHAWVHGTADSTSPPGPGCSSRRSSPATSTSKLSHLGQGRTASGLLCSRPTGV